jgi:hypothetical protein
VQVVGSAGVAIYKKTLITYNEPSLTEQMPTLQEAAGKENVILTEAVT